MARLLLLSVGTAAAFMVRAPTMAPRVASIAKPIAKMSVVDDIKDSLVPKNTDSTLANVMGLQMTGWGVGALCVPTRMMETIFGATPTGVALPLMRGMGLAMLSLGAKTCAGGDSAAAVDGFLFYGLWYKVLGAAMAAGTFAAYTQYVTLWNGLCALACARRMGGLFDTITKIDMGTLSSLLPRDKETSLRNLLGVQLLGWGIVCAFYQPFFFGAYIANTASTAISSLAMTGVGIANVLLGGRVFGGSDADAAANGAVILGGWGVIGWLAKSAGVMTGSMMTAISVWNLAFAAYCIKEMLD